MKYYPIEQIAMLLPRYEAQARCDRLNSKYQEVHFKPRKESETGYQVVAAMRDGSTPELAHS